MDRKSLLAGAAAALLLGAGGPTVAAPYNSDDSAAARQPPRMMQDENMERTGRMMSRQGRGGMMGPGMMGYGMPGDCPMMGAFMQEGANAKVMMQMHGEMMRAMGDIMMKYADKLEAPPAPK